MKSLDKDKEGKRFREWIELKEKIHYGKSVPKINEGDIWWCGCGENVGIEINGKSSRFSRPVLIMKKLGYRGFMGIPLTSQEKRGTWYTKFNFLGRDTYAALCQARVMSTSRLYSRIGRLAERDLDLVKKGFQNLFK